MVFFRGPSSQIIQDVDHRCIPSQFIAPDYFATNLSTPRHPSKSCFNTTGLTAWQRTTPLFTSDHGLNSLGMKTQASLVRLCWLASIGKRLRRVPVSVLSNLNSLPLPVFLVSVSKSRELAERTPHQNSAMLTRWTSIKETRDYDCLTQAFPLETTHSGNHVSRFGVSESKFCDPSPNLPRWIEAPVHLIRLL